MFLFIFFSLLVLKEMLMEQEMVKKIVAVVMIGYLSKAMPELPGKIEKIMSMPLAKMMFVAGLMYLNSGDAMVSVLSALVLFSAVYLIKLVIREPFEDADMEEIRHNEYYSNLTDADKMTAGESINSMMADITEKAADVKNYYLEQCHCNETKSAKMQVKL